MMGRNKPAYHQEVSMKIHSLEYLPVDTVFVIDAVNECGVHSLTTPRPEAVSLYGHWCHVRYPGGAVESFPVHRIHSILWS